MAHVEAHPHDIVNLTMAEFGVTRTTVHRHLNTLIKADKIEKIGVTNTSQYFLKESFNKVISFKITEDLSESDIWQKEFSSIATKLKPNIEEICYYSFTEMVNNAKDHSEGSRVIIASEKKGNKLIFSISDNGVGIFKKIKDAFGLDDERESVLQLSKGKLTTDKSRHSGEGIFFTSRAVDCFEILANGIFYLRANTQEGWFVQEKKNTSNYSTVVQFEIETTSDRRLRNVFEKYQNPETMAFDRTHILVSLSLSNEDHFVSRSQAKRIMLGLEKFNHIILDFKGIKTVGQAFVDEVFRVFKERFPHIEIDVTNTNEDIDFMIKRGIETAKLNNKSRNDNK